MYLGHFGLNEPPFRITPHTDFFFAGANRGATLEALLYAIGHEEGIIKITGEVGSGKTMLCRVLIERLPKHIETIYLANPSLSRDEILHTIADDLRVSVEGRRTTVLLRALQEDLIRRYAAGKRVVVLIDEAHAMPLETLEEIRLLSNLESNRHKLLHIVLFGQPELDQHLSLPHMRQIKERIIHSFRLEPLVRDDVAQYIEFRMRAAGYRGPSVFTPAALRMIAQASQGLTRRVNILADKSLLAAFAEGTHQVTVKQARAAVRDAEFTRTRRRAGVWWVAGAGLAVGLAIGLALHLYPSLARWGAAPETHARAIGPGPAAAPAPHPDAAPPTEAAPMAPAPAAPAGAAGPQPAAAGEPVSQASGAAPAPTAPAPTAAPVDTAMATAESTPATSPATSPAAPPAASPAAPTPPATAPKSEAESATAAVAAAATAARTQAARANAATPPTAAPAATPAAGPRPPSGGELARRRFAATQEWLETAPPKHYAIELLTVSAANVDVLEDLLGQVARLLSIEQTHVYSVRLEGRQFYALAYGNYPSVADTITAMGQLPETFKARTPYPRSFRLMRTQNQQ
ncbi:MAG: AAA family ATPase [Burkholderiales bacterium]|nr:AAA family ATPase [Burkholderiales bacterium]